MMTETISVLIPTFNRKHFLGACIESILQQSHQNIFIIVYDDGSTDGTAKFLEKYPKLRVVRDPVNRGISHARNQLLDLCKTKMAAWQDSDDVSNIHRITRQYELAKNSGAPIVYCNYRYDKAITNEWKSEPRVLNLGNTCMGGAFIDVERCKNVRFDLDITLGGEDLVWRREVEQIYGAPALVDELLYHVRMHPTRISRTKRLPEFRGRKVQSSRAYASAMKRLDANE
jgi:glycosyltransferase involved in cell wall biosynthesis